MKTVLLIDAIWLILMGVIWKNNDLVNRLFKLVFVGLGIWSLWILK